MCKRHSIPLTQSVSSKDDDNNLLVSILNVLILLGKYGYYDNSGDVCDVMKPLKEILQKYNELLEKVRNESKTNQRKMEPGKEEWLGTYMCDAL